MEVDRRGNSSYITTTTNRNILIDSPLFLSFLPLLIKECITDAVAAWAEIGEEAAASRADRGVVTRTSFNVTPPHDPAPRRRPFPVSLLPFSLLHFAILHLTSLYFTLLYFTLLHFTIIP